MIANYKEGTPPDDAAGRSAWKPEQILGTPYSKAYLLGLVGSDWHDFFLNIPPWFGAKFVNTPNWLNAQTHNFFPWKHRYKLLKWLYKETWEISEEEMKEGWTCPEYPEANPAPVPEVDPIALAKAGIKCPYYYKASSCVDCTGWFDPKQRDLFFETRDGNPLSELIVEYPKRSKQCLELEKLNLGPRNNQNIHTLRLISMSQSIKNDKTSGFTSYVDCTQCRENYWIAIAPVHKVAANIHADPVAINSIDPAKGPAGVEALIANQVAAGNVAYRRMFKDNGVNTAFYNRLGKGGNPFYYLVGDTCYVACFYDPNIGHVDVGGVACTPPQLSAWSQYIAGAGGAMTFNAGVYQTIHSTTFSRPLWEDPDGPCECEKAAGGSGAANGGKYPIGKFGKYYNKCYPPDPIPNVNCDKVPKDVSLEVSTATPTTTHTFSVTVQNAGAIPSLKYQWYLDGTAIPETGTGSTRRVFTLTNIDLSYNKKRVHCVISSSGGSVKCGPCTLIVNHTKHKIHPDDKKVFLANSEAFCCDQSDLLKLWKKGLFLGYSILPPDGRVDSTGFARVYLDPGQYDPEKADASDFEGHYWIFPGNTHFCSGGTGAMFTIVKITRVVVEKWEDVPVGLKGVQPNGDESRDDDKVLGLSLLEYNQLLGLFTDCANLSVGEWDRTCLSSCKKGGRDELRQLFNINRNGTVGSGAI
jgi:hypothetical protein